MTFLLIVSPPIVIGGGHTRGIGRWRTLAVVRSRRPAVVYLTARRTCIRLWNNTIMLSEQHQRTTKPNPLTIILKLDGDQRAQTSAKASNLNWKWSVIRIQISELIHIRIRMSAGWLPKCCGFIILSASVISLSVVKIGRWLYEKWEMLKSLLKSSILQWRRKWKSDLESVSEIGSSTKVAFLFRSVGPIITPSLVSVQSASYFCSNPAHRRNDRPERILVTSVLLSVREQTICDELQRNKLYCECEIFPVDFQFLSRVSILTRDIDIANLSVRPSVCPSVRYVPVLYENGLTYCYSFCTAR